MLILSVPMNRTGCDPEFESGLLKWSDVLSCSSWRLPARKNTDG